MLGLAHLSSLHVGQVNSEMGQAKIMGLHGYVHAV